MRFARGLLLAAMFTAGCGDNIINEDGVTAKSPSSSSAVGGSQVSHSKSFMLVTSVSSANQPISKNSSVTLKPGIGAN